jgi:D-alanyl-D-alanine carboxypeptidase (penicillin-binding protein 5/6)
LAFRPKDVPKHSTNKLLGRLAGCDGLKTGYTRAAGFCITATAKRNDIRLICVVMGEASNRGRFDTAGAMLEKCFAEVQRVHVVQGGSYLTRPVTIVNGEERAVRMAAQDDIWVTVKATDVPRLETFTVCPERVSAPLSGQAAVGEVRVQLGEVVLARTPLVTPYDLVEATKSAALCVR